MAAWGTQYKVGDQDKQTRLEFAKNHYKICPKCNSRDIEMKHDVAACRMNGDAYGTDVYTCKVCKWNTSYQWDEASDNYYYELN